MSRRTITALSIARPLMEMLAVQPFSGRVLGRFERACNVVDGQGRVIALTLPEIGNGPFSIIVEDWPGLFDAFRLNQPAYADGRSLVIGEWGVNLSTVRVWEPQLAGSNQSLELNPALAEMLKPFVAWPRLPDATPAARITNRLAREVATQLKQVLIQHEKHERHEGHERLEKIEEAVGQLAGLGGGLTPAGDDYLIGVMAALWLTGYKNWPSQMAAVAAPKTTTLSAAFLRAAGRGEFIESWHELAQALFAGVPETFSQAVKRVAQFGASSGLDALAGFATTILCVTSILSSAKRSGARIERCVLSEVEKVLTFWAL